jgi:hypothetical protein
MNRNEDELMILTGTLLSKTIQKEDVESLREVIRFHDSKYYSDSDFADF